MAIYNMQLSQNVIDQLHTLAQSGRVDTAVGNFVNVISDTLYRITPDARFESYDWDGSTLRVHYAGGATETYTGVVMDNPNATSGHATATGYELHQPGTAIETLGGQLNFDYSIGPDGARITTSPQGHLLTSLRTGTEYPASSSSYDPVLGNITTEFDGRMTLSADYKSSGNVTRITATAEKFLQSIIVDGDFQIGPNQSGLTGVETGYQELYRDGSATRISGAAFDLGASGDLGQGALHDPAFYGGSDDFAVDLPAHLYERTVVTPGDGDDRVSLKGGGGLLDLDAGAGADRITLLGDAHAVDGGAGLDTVVLSGARAAYDVRHAASGSSAYTVTDTAGTADQLANVERLRFSDSAYALDIDGNGGQAYRIYQAAFNRTPDSAGLGFWINSLDLGESLVQVAQGFVASDEYRDTYGSGLANHDLVTRYYENILHRAPEQAGLDYWTNILDTHAASVPEVLAFISESAENKDGLASVIGNGFAYTPYGQA